MTRIIKRYENRKLYDTESRRYISLEEIARLIREGIDVKVVDKNTKQDITAQTLTQVILEEGKKGRTLLSKEMLHTIIRWGNTLIDDGWQQVTQQLDHLVPTPLARLLGHKKDSEIEQLKARIESLERMIQQLMDDKKKSSS
ncbi:MAG: hypothetical protein GXO78_06175 [Calditrichaeota bacterium]|nr:hypothetical protein [Calditrichota bacterium]